MEEIGNTIYSGFLGFVVYGRYYILWSEEGKKKGKGRKRKGKRGEALALDMFNT